MKKIKYLLLIVLFIGSIITLRVITKALYPSQAYVPKVAPVIDAPEGTTIAFIIDGEISETLPIYDFYVTSVECTDSNATSNVTWVNGAWNVSIGNIQSGNTKCNVIFEKVDAPAGWLNPPENSVQEGMQENYEEPEPPIVSPGVGPSSPSEAILAAAEDDYGTTYYYRGAVEDNFIIFANMCWRILRIDGIGNVKIILYNQNTSGTTNPCNVSGDTLAYARDVGSNSVITAVYNNTGNYNASMGLLFGIQNSSSYDLEHNPVSGNKSPLLTALEDWYADTLTSYTSYLADVIYCNDLSLAPEDYKPAKSANYTNKGYGAQSTAYGLVYRLVSTTTWNASDNSNPTFKCPDASGNDPDLSRFTVANGKLLYPIGLITGDEASFAGACYGANCSNSSYFLQANATSNEWWTMTPGNFDGKNQDNKKARIAYIAQGKYIRAEAATNAYRIRPVVTLKSSVRIGVLPSADTTYDFGRKQNPFVVTGLES